MLFLGLSAQVFIRSRWYFYRQLFHFLRGKTNMQTILSIVQKINFYLSDYILVFLLVGTGIFFSIKTRFVQVRCFG